MFVCEIWLFDWYFPQFCTSDMSKYGYLEVFQWVPSTSGSREPTVLDYFGILFILDLNSVPTEFKLWDQRLLKELFCENS